MAPGPQVERHVSPASDAPRWWWLLAALPLLPVLGLGFFNDDYAGLVEFGARGWAGVLQSFHPTDFEFMRPLGFLLFRAELSVFGARALLFHATHLALFVLGAWLAGRLAANLAGPRAAPWAAAFALLYPGRFEAVAWVAAVFDLVALLLVTAALVVATAPEWGGRPRQLVLLAGACFLAPLAKESAYALALVLVAWELLGALAPAPARFRALRSLAVLAGAGAASAFRLLVFGGVGGYANVPLSGAFVKALGLPEAVLRVIVLPVNPSYGAASIAIAVLCTAAVLPAAGAALVRGTPQARRALWAGLALVVAGLLPSLPYLDPSRLTWSHSRLVTLSGLGVVLVAAAGVQACGRWRTAAGLVLLAAWCGGTLLEVHTWRWAAHERDVIIAGVERATREPGTHVVWVAGPIDDDPRGARLAGRLPEAVQLALPDRHITVDSEFVQHWERRAVGPPRVPAGVRLHIFLFDPTGPELRPLTHWEPPGVAR